MTEEDSNLDEYKKTRVNPPLVNKMLNHPCGAYGWHKLYDPSLCEIVPSLYEGGKTDAEVAAIIGISVNTFWRWRKQYPAFKSAVEYGKTKSEAHMSVVGREAAEGMRKIDGKVWHIIMRNQYGYDKDNDSAATKEDIENAGNRIAELIKEHAKPY